GHSHASVRQRVCRLRATLRKRWVAELALVGVALVCLLVLVLPSDRPEPTPTSQSAAVTLPRLQGHWRIVELQPHAGLDAVRSSLARVAPQTVEVRVQGDQLWVRAPMAQGQRRLEVIASSDGGYEVCLHGNGGVQTAQVRFNRNGTLTVESDAGPWRGRAVLAR
ncbi:MAG: hypothetical protein ACOC1F_02895, partial [Myxococcota bacterium]